MLKQEGGGRRVWVWVMAMVIGRAGERGVCVFVAVA